MKTPICISCHRDIKWAELGEEDGQKYDQVDDGGNVEIRFHYGSIHDQLLGWNDNYEPYRGYICDDCAKYLIDKEIIEVRNG